MKLASYLESQHFKTAARFLIKRTRITGIFFYALATIGFLILPREDISRNIYVDENALMPGLAKRRFDDAATVNSIASALRGRSQSESISVVEEELFKLGLEVYEQNYTALPPISLGQQSTPTILGRNIYGILRASRASTTEAIILLAPFHTRNGASNIYGIALTLSLAKYFRTKNYWAKDLIFLFASEGDLGVEAWMDAYLGEHRPGIVAGSLGGHSGVIQAVFNLELESPSFEFVEIVVGGTNGILPNLDMVDVAMHLCLVEGIQTTFHAPLPHDFSYQQSLKGMLLFGAHLTPGLPTGNHALFLRHRIDAITIRGIGNAQEEIIVKLGRAMEGIIRSFNNLLETLHHSMYFYLLPSLGKFVSIAFYSPPFGLFLVPLVLEALKQWLVARIPDLSQTQSPNNQGPLKESPFPFGKLTVTLLVSYGSGGLMYYLPGLGCNYLGSLSITVFLAVLLCICGLSVALPLLARPTLTDHEWRIVKCFSLLLLIIMLAAFAVLNYPLAVCLAVSLSLPCTIAQPSGLSSTFVHKLHQFLLLLSSPPLWALYLCTLYAFFTSAPDASFHDAVIDSVAMAMTGVGLAYNDWHLFGCWLYWVLCLCVWPLWMGAWFMTCHRVLPSPEDEPPISGTPLATNPYQEKDLDEPVTASLRDNQVF